MFIVVHVVICVGCILFGMPKRRKRRRGECNGRMALSSVFSYSHNFKIYSAVTKRKSFQSYFTYSAHVFSWELN